MKKLSEQYHKFIKKENQLFCENQQFIAHINRSLLRWMLFISLAVSVLTTVFCFFMDGYNSLRVTYITITVVLLSALFVQKKIPDNWILFSFYSLFVMIMSYASYSSAVMFPEYSGALAWGILIVMPVLILDKNKRITGTVLITLVCYLWFVIPMKLPDQREDEIVYIIVFSLAGLMLGFYMRWVRLENLELLRQSLVRETTDVLTGLYNRRKLFDYFIECEAGREEKPVTGISMLDIDFFKLYNDTYGHLAGDHCLKMIGTCLAEYGKQHDMEFYRYGGEEFVAIAHEQDRERLMRCFENVVMSVAILQIPHQGKENGIVTMSQGVFLLPLDQDEEISASSNDYDETYEGKHLNGFRAQQYLSKADAALYQAKSQGRNRTFLFQDK